ncbi:MAG: CHAD domain-containing protein, partial [Chloroflexota bacterium]
MTDAADLLKVGPGHEVELKYHVHDRAAAEHLLALSVWGSTDVTGGRVRTVQVEDRYVDTADGALAQAGYAVRLRETRGDTIVSVKSLHATTGAGGAFRRVELEGPADRTAPAGEWAASDARSLVLEHAGDAPLVERVTIRQLRHKRVIKAGTTRVELSLDDIDVVAGGRIVGSFVDFEAELIKGDETVLGEIARTMDAAPGLARADTSKLEMALALVAVGDGNADMDDGALAVPVAPTAELTIPRLTPGKTPGVVADDHVAEAARKVLRFHVARMLLQEPGTREGDVVALHKMRVATRRQRAAWRVFGESFRAGRTRRYRGRLREVAARLGAVRDLDVLLEGADEYRADLPTTEQRALEPLLTAWRDHREDARRLLMRELDSDGYRRWLDDYVDFVRTEGTAVLPVGPVQPHRVRDTAPSRIWAAYEVVRGYEPVLRWADVETLHDLRIAGKWLRYTLEFVREALGPGA